MFKLRQFLRKCDQSSGVARQICHRVAWYIGESRATLIAAFDVLLNCWAIAYLGMAEQKCRQLFERWMIDAGIFHESQNGELGAGKCL